MEFFCYHRDRRDSLALADIEVHHWQFGGRPS
jgi:hypothetical protein